MVIKSALIEMYCIEDTEINLVPQVTSSAHRQEANFLIRDCATSLTLLFFAYSGCSAGAWAGEERNSGEKATV